MARRIDTKNFIVDCIGNGKGVADGLKVDAMKYSVQYFNSAKKEDVPETYANKKAQAVDWAAQEMRKLLVEPVKDAETRRQLVALSRYKITNSGKMIMQPNDECKKVIGCSPDRGLTYVYGRWGIRWVKSEIREEITYRERKAMSMNQAAMSV